MGEAIPGVNVQALAAFFSKHFEQPKTSTQPRPKNQKNKTLLKLLEFSSKQDLATCKNSDSSSFCRSLSSFDLSNSGKHLHVAHKGANPFKRKQHLNQKCITSIPSTSSLVNGNISARKKMCQDNNCGLDTTSNDSGVDENSESSTIEDSRTNDQHILHPLNNFLPLSGNPQGQNNLPDNDGSKRSGQWSPTVNIIVKEPFSENNNCVQSAVINDNKNIVTTVWNRTYEVDINTEIEKNLVNKLPPDRLFYSEIVVSDNYVCKAQYRRTELPSTEVLGPPPCKPKKPDNIKFALLSPNRCFFQKQILLPRAEGRLGGGNCYPQMQHISELPSQSSMQEHTDDIFRQRTLSDTGPKSSCSHQKQRYFHELAEELCNKSNHDISVSSPPSLPPRRLSCPSYVSGKSGSVSDIPEEELYHDAEVEDENLYEEVPFPNDCQSHIYVNHAKSNKTGKEMARLLQKENRERIRRERELEKLRRKFGLTGEEVPLEKGYIKKDAKGGRGDLAVKKGESVLIVRIVNNPIGRLLVQNEKGKIGYVALDNLIIDADAIKTVMRERKHFMENKERSYSNSSSNAYATYEDY